MRGHRMNALGPELTVNLLQIEDSQTVNPTNLLSL